MQIAELRGRFERISRSVTFARHMPPRKILRRLRLEFARRISIVALGSSRRLKPTPFLAAIAPLRSFPPRAAELQWSDAQGWIAHFLHRRVVLGTRIDWRTHGESAEDQLWLMHLHYQEYLEALDDEAMVNLIEQWIEACASPGARWWRAIWNSYTLSIRTVVWMQVLAARRPGLSARFIDAAHASLAQQIRVLVANLETDLGGNHLIKNIKALLWASAYFSGKEADRWRRIGLRRLTSELAAQVLADGVHFERSASYHAQVFCDLLECRVALGTGAADVAEFDDALDRMAQACADLAHPDGAIAQFNDAGLDMAYAPSVCLAAYTRIMGRVAPLPRPVFAFPNAGYFGARTSKGLCVIADCGRIGPDDLPAHAHGDVLSFELSAGGHRFVVDQGVFEYIAGSRRIASRSAISHNTSAFDQFDQADFYGAFRCGRRPNVKVLKWAARPDGFDLEGEHDGYRSALGAPIARRRFELDGGNLQIDDLMDGATSDASAGLLLHPEVVASALNGGWRLSRGGVTLNVSASGPLEIEPAVWWPNLGCEVATMRLRLKIPAGGVGASTTIRLVDRS